MSPPADQPSPRPLPDKLGAPTAAVILAAGRAARFGGAKLLSELDGRPILQHVLDLAAQAELEPVVVVLGADAAAFEATLEWRSEIRVLNPHAERGISSSLQIGLGPLERARARRALILLGDQPRLTLGQLRHMLDVVPDAARPIAVPRYAEGGNRNPVLLERVAWPLARGLTGDRGMSQLFAARPELVRYVDLPGTNPDIDTPADLVALARRRQ